jgi:hypothetical protein
VQAQPQLHCCNAGLHASTSLLLCQLSIQHQQQPPASATATVPALPAQQQPLAAASASWQVCGCSARSLASSDMPPDMWTSGKASSNKGQLQQQQDMADMGVARPGAAPSPDAAATRPYEVCGSRCLQRWILYGGSCTAYVEKHVDHNVCNDCVSHWLARSCHTASLVCSTAPLAETATDGPLNVQVLTPLQVMASIPSWRKCDTLLLLLPLSSRDPSLVLLGACDQLPWSAGLPLDCRRRPCGHNSVSLTSSPVVSWCILQ